MITDTKLKELIHFDLEHGEQKTLETFNIKSETLNRRRREYKERFGDLNLDKSVTLKKISEQYSDDELKAIAKGGRLIPGQDKIPIVSFTGEKIKFAHFTDTHIGSIYFKPEYLKLAIDECKKEGVEFICHSGDVVDGMSNRPDHIYELSHIGYDKQREYAIEQLNQWDKKWYFIDGNHDRYFIKSNGAIIVKDICEKLNDAEFLGHDEGDISLKGNAVIKLWHGGDGSSYATSYRPQKLIEAFTGGTKPNILLCGHTHKQVYIFDRHIHCVSGGAICTQSSFMRGKRLANHTGFWIIEATINKSGVSKFNTTWYPFYA